MTQTTSCPQPGCGHRAVILERYVLDSTDGPVEHFKIRCPDSHFFNCAVSSVANADG